MAKKTILADGPKLPRSFRRPADPNAAMEAILRIAAFSDWCMATARSFAWRARRAQEAENWCQEVLTRMTNTPTWFVEAGKKNHHLQKSFCGTFKVALGRLRTDEGRSAYHRRQRTGQETVLNALPDRAGRPGDVRAERQEEEGLLAGQIAMLEPRQRHVVKSRLRDVPYAIIAKELSISPGYAKKIHRMAVRQLRIWMARSHQRQSRR